MTFKTIPPLYNVWADMKARCRNPHAKSWKDYGGRGISVCERWRTSYSTFVSDMGPRPDGYVLDRINNDGNYEPENCRWVDRVTSQRNRRVCVRVTIEGKEYLLADLADKSPLKRDVVLERARQGMTLEQVLSPEKRRDLSGLALGGIANGARNRAKTHCKSGHEFTDANTFVTPEGWRKCRRCAADRQAVINRRNTARKQNPAG